MVLVPKQSAGGEIMSKQQERSRREVGGAVFAVIFCVALALGLWWGARRMPARTPQNKVAETSANQAVDSETSFYCNTKSLSVLEWAHKGQISEKMKIARVERKELANGYAFRFRPEAVSLVELADWVSSEARCCPFFDMSIEVEPNGGPLWLRLTGKEGVKQFIRMEFKLEGEERKQ
jgi:hypothetical protein